LSTGFNPVNTASVEFSTRRRSKERPNQWRSKERNWGHPPWGHINTLYIQFKNAYL